MSTEKIVRGRYAQKIIKEKNKKQFQPPDVVTISLLPAYSDLDDLIIRNSNNIYSIRQIKWFDTLPNLQEIMYNIQKCIYSPVHSIDTFVQVLEGTGKHVDDRRIALQLIEDLLEVVLLKLLPFIKQLPGMMEVKRKDFFRDFLSSGGLLHLVLSMENICALENEFLIINLNGHKVVVGIEVARAVMSERLVDFKRRSQVLLQECKLTDEEFSFVCALNLLSPQRGIPVLNYHYKRMVSAFTRYLTTTYGRDYIRKFQAIIALMSHYSQCPFIRSGGSRNGLKYYNLVYRKPLVKAVYGLGNLEDHLRNITSVHIPQN